MIKSNTLIACFIALLSMYSCKEEPKEKEDLTYVFNPPAHFPEVQYTFSNNPVTKEGFELGKKLFFDADLSRDRSVSCNNCHHQAFAFADLPLHRLSVGVEDRLGTRNAPALVNLAFQKEFFWDGGVTHLDFVPINAIEADFEMDEDITNVVARLNEDPDYLKAFKDAFDTDVITSPYIFHALSQFMNLMVSGNSKYDQEIQGKTIFTAIEKQGEDLFELHCAACHSGVLQTDNDYHNNGLDSVFTDLGRGKITESVLDNGKFKTPSLRNIALTAPYMHDGRFSSLEKVLDHYDSGVVLSTTLDERLKNGIPLTENEKQSLIAFLKTLTDESFINDKKFNQINN